MMRLLALLLIAATISAQAQDAPVRPPRDIRVPQRTDIGTPECAINCGDLNPKIAPPVQVPHPKGSNIPVPSKAEMLGPQFVFAWTQDDVETIRKALSKVPERHGIDDYQMRRLNYTMKILDAGTALVDKDGKPWATYSMSGIEAGFIGMAVSNDRYCRAEDALVEDMNDIDNILIAGVYCWISNYRANKVTEQIKSSRHIIPGGAP